ncbi:MAG: hypothetical protein A3G13_01155 [Candidatus Levybacteria bacterium RIFCSPLOWO2_12_FULL_37_7]|nr:MAG: hypothetical protein A3G13_01155 [Candidatus Levybacteria bacterium RIFCSPLOWO2_12_FULL_37_7]
MIDLEKLIGPCRVLDLADMFSRHSGDSGLSRGLQNQKKRDSGRGRLGDLARMTYDLEILPEDLVQFSIKKGDRILFKTGNYKLLKQPTFPDSYISLSLKGAEYLLKKGAVLVGTDFLGIEKEKNPGHPVHTALLKAGIVIAEGLDLSEVPEGEYKLICLPLRVSSDGSPVRAVLIKS